MLGSLIEQLFRTRLHQKALFDIIKPLYDCLGSSPCNIESLWKILQEMTTSFPVPVHIILDALDECNDRASIFSHISKTRAQFFFTSRPEPDIKTAISENQPFDVIYMDVHEDIKDYVQSRVGNSGPLAPFKDRIVTKILGTSDGMFRYAGLMIEELQKRPGNRPIQEILDSLPKGVNQMYKLALQRLPEDLADLRRTTLMYIAHAFRPVTPEEVILAHSAKPGEGDFDPSSRIMMTRNDLFYSCGSLIETFRTDLYFMPDKRREEIEALRFTHLTVKDFV